MDARTRFRHLIRTSPLSQSEISRRVGKSPMWLSDRMRGHSEIMVDDVAKIARAMDVNPCEFLRGVGEPEVENAPPDVGEPVVDAAPQPRPALDRMLAEYERELERAHGGEPMDSAIERVFVAYLRELYRLEAGDAHLIVQLAAKLGHRQE